MHNPSSHLSPRDLAIVRMVSRLHQLSSTQIQRLAFSDGSPISRARRTRRALERLTKWGAVRRLEARPVGGYAGGSGQFIYTPTTARDRAPNPHTLDIAEIFVQLFEKQREGTIVLKAFDGEPYSHVQLGNLIYKPDARVHLKTASGEYVYFVEQDNATEYRTQLGEKMRRAVKAYRRWPRSQDAAEDTFPLVLWVVPDKQRQRFVQSVIDRQEEPLFDIVLFDQAIDYLTK